MPTASPKTKKKKNCFYQIKNKSKTKDNLDLQLFAETLEVLRKYKL